VLFIVTFLTSIPALGLFQPVLDDPVGYITGGGKDNQIWSSFNAAPSSGAYRRAAYPEPIEQNICRRAGGNLTLST